MQQDYLSWLSPLALEPTASTSSSSIGTNNISGSSFLNKKRNSGREASLALSSSKGLQGQDRRGKDLPGLFSLLGGPDNSDTKRKTEEKRFKEN